MHGKTTGRAEEIMTFLVGGRKIHVMIILTVRDRTRCETSTATFTSWQFALAKAEETRAGGLIWPEVHRFTSPKSHLPVMDTGTSHKHNLQDLKTKPGIYASLSTALTSSSIKGTCLRSSLYSFIKLYSPMPEPLQLPLLESIGKSGTDS